MKKLNVSNLNLNDTIIKVEAIQVELDLSSIDTIYKQELEAIQSYIYEELRYNYKRIKNDYPFGRMLFNNLFDYLNKNSIISEDVTSNINYQIILL